MISQQVNKRNAMAWRWISGIFFLLGLVIAYYGLSHHLVRTQEATLRLSKQHLSISETFVDVRDWTVDDFHAHPVVTQALLNQGQGHVVPAELALTSNVADPASP